MTRQPLRHRERLDRWARQVPKPIGVDDGLDRMAWVAGVALCLLGVAIMVWG